MSELVPISGHDLDTIRIMPTQQVIDFFLNRETVGTARTYGSTLHSFFAWCPKDFRAVTPFDALGYADFLGATVSPATVQNRISTLSRFFRFAKDCGLIETNPFAVVKQKKVPNRAQEKFLTVKELDRLLKALSIAGQREYVLGLLLASLGLRISEAWGLSHSDFLEAPDGSIEVRVLRKGGEIQLLPLRDDVWQVVRDFMGHDANSFSQVPLFLNPSKKRASVNSLRTWIEEAAKRAGIERKISPHWIRHSCATHLLDHGASLENVKWLLNHKNLLTTAIYLHETDKRISEKMPIEVK